MARFFHVYMSKGLEIYIYTEVQKAPNETLLICDFMWE